MTRSSATRLHRRLRARRYQPPPRGRFVQAPTENQAKDRTLAGKARRRARKAGQ